MKQYTLSSKGRECVTVGDSLVLKTLLDEDSSFTIEELEEILPFGPEELEQMLKDLSREGYIDYVEFKQ